MERRNETLIKVAQTGLMDDLSCETFSFFKIKILMPGGGAKSFSVGNVCTVVETMILGG